MAHRKGLRGLYAADQSEMRHGGRFRWLVSTFLAAAVAAVAILVVIAGSTDGDEMDGGIMTTIQRMREARVSARRVAAAKVDGLRWAVPKTDRLLVPTGAMATKFIILDAVRQRRGNRDYIMNKPYARIAARLAPLSKADAGRVPPLNPFKLYASNAPLDPVGRAETSQDAVVKIVEQFGGLFPAEDAQELSMADITEIVGRFLVPDKNAFDAADRVAGGELLADRALRASADITLANTTTLAKSTGDGDDPLDEEGREVRVVKVQRGDTLPRILQRLGAEPWHARAMTDAARSIFPERDLQPGMEMQVTLLPSVTRANRMDPVRYTIFGEGREHKVTVQRDAAGDFTASASPVDRRVASTESTEEDTNVGAGSSLYASLYQTAQRQGVDGETIFQILRTHAYETDFRQRIRAGDGFEFFFDIRDEEKGADGSLGELLATSITAGGKTTKFYRFRSPDGSIDYYDENGDTSRRFLMRRPVRSDDVRITSGFGVRRHPVLQIPRMHTGIDWACAMGTPIMAAGSGVLEEVGRKGEYGNYIRIRHANGYKTAYGHMQRFAPGMAAGGFVRQGQIIGYVGTTGLSSGPHLHYEVLVNNTFVDPNAIQVPRERQLAGTQLAEFQRERQRIDELMRRNPASTRLANVTGG
ncbi:MAG: M23 family metallopeptidase [Hyphomicrobiaceae bacterium]|nr:M23 family metallopeptidase [Hyphomicrobiaceae bacterium]